MGMKHIELKPFSKYTWFLTEETLLSRLAPNKEDLPNPTDQQLPVLILRGYINSPESVQAVVCVSTPRIPAKRVFTSIIQY